jgi:RHS repeat-associated protein
MKPATSPPGPGKFVSFLSSFLLTLLLFGLVPQTQACEGESQGGSAATSTASGNEGGDGGGAPPSEQCSVPVNLVTGEFWTEVKDAALPSTGEAFKFVRRYNSFSTIAKPFGKGWTFSYAAALNIKSDSIDYQNGSGQVFSYKGTGSGPFQAPAGVRTQLRSTVSGYELIQSDQTHLLFDASGHLTQQTDRNGQGLAFAYNGANQLASITDSAGRTVTLDYNADGLVTQLNLADGRTVKYQYTSGLLTTVTDLRGNTNTYGYDSKQRLNTIHDANGNLAATLIYNSKGRVIDQTNPCYSHDTYVYTTVGVFSYTTWTDGLGNKTKYKFSNNLLVEVDNAFGVAKVYDYDTNLNLVKLYNGTAAKTTMTYDAAGNLLTRTSPVPHRTQNYTYDVFNNPLTYQDGKGNTTAYAYDALGNLTTTTYPDGTTASIVRDSAGRPTSITNELGKTTVLTYDSQGNLTSATTPEGRTTRFEYDASGRKTAAVDPLGNRTSFVYDKADHLIQRTDPLGQTTLYAYDANGNRTSVTDANGHVTAYTFDGLNRLTQVTAPDNTVTAYQYDAVDNLVQRTDANGHITRYSYDAVKRLTGIVNPGGGTFAYTYDTRNNLISVTDAKGVKTSRTFDLLDRLTKISYSDATPPVSFGYDANDNRTKMIDQAGTTYYTYDVRNRLITVKSPGPSGAFAYAYDPAGRVINKTYPGQSASSFAYDGDGRMVATTVAAKTTTYAYDAAARLVQTLLPNGYEEDRQYDAAGQLTRITSTRNATALTDFQYTYDKAGNPLSETALSGNTLYSYDVRDRLATVCYAAGGCATPDLSYAYDAVGNRLSETRPAGVTQYAYDADDQLVNSQGPTGIIGYTYDANGNQTTAGPRSFVYDAANRLTTTAAGGSTAAYAYDGNGLRVTATSNASGSDVTTTYRWDINSGLPLLATEVDAQGKLLRGYAYANSITPLSLKTPTNRYYYHPNNLGSTAAISSATGATVAQYAYEPFGTVRQQQVAANAPANPILYTGQYQDDTGLYHLRARQYDTTTGRFLGRDPIANRIGDPFVARYVYANNSPTLFVDPTGETTAGAFYGGLVGLTIGIAAASLAGPEAVGIGLALGIITGDYLTGSNPAPGASNGQSGSYNWSASGGKSGGGATIWFSVSLQGETYSTPKSTGNIFDKNKKDEQKDEQAPCEW